MAEAGSPTRTVPHTVRRLGFAATLLGLSSREVDFERRRFPAARPLLRAHLERAGAAFVDGYNAALQVPDVGELAAELARFDGDLTGFAHEGASMALALLDLLTPWKASRWQALVDRAGDRHIYLCLVGAGWALPRLLRRALPGFIERDVLWPLVYDGFGFHQGFFHHERFILRRARPPLRGYARQAFDQGLGRSLWFSRAAEPERIAAAIGAFDPGRQADLWSGVGLAAGYAGGVGGGALERLGSLAVACRPHLLQGVVFAAAARARAGNVTDDCELACRILCASSAADAAAMAERELRASNVTPDSQRDGAAYADWRQRIRSNF